MFASEIIGHDRIREVLGAAVAKSRVPPALLLSGPDGIGKKTLALAVARGLLCEKGPGDPCLRCSHCRRIARSLEVLPQWRSDAKDRTDEPLRLNHRLHPDVILVEPWRTATRTEIKIAQVRSLVGEVVGRPFEARARVFVIDDAHAMNEQAANALLKSLEEPPETSHLILVTPARQALLPTIRSRCQTLRLGPLPSTALEGYLRDRAGLDPSEVKIRMAVAAGSLGAALGLETESYSELRAQVLEVMEGGARGGTLARLEAAERIVDEEEPVRALLVLRSMLRDTLAIRAGVPDTGLLNGDLAKRLRTVAAGPLGENAHAVAEVAERGRLALAGNANKTMVLDVVMDCLAAPDPL